MPFICDVDAPLELDHPIERTWLAEGAGAACLTTSAQDFQAARAHARVGGTAELRALIPLAHARAKELDPVAWRAWQHNASRASSGARIAEWMSIAGATAVQVKRTQPSGRPPTVTRS